MASYKALIKNALDEKGIRYREPEDGILTISYGGHNINDIDVIVDIDPDEGKIQLICYSIGKFEQEQFAKALIACNACNARFRWVKFSVDEDNEIVVRADAILDEETCGEECFELVVRMIQIIDDAYPAFMKARWS